MVHFPASRCDEKFIGISMFFVIQSLALSSIACAARTRTVSFGSFSPMFPEHPATVYALNNSLDVDQGSSLQDAITQGEIPSVKDLNFYSASPIYSPPLPPPFYLIRLWHRYDAAFVRHRETSVRRAVPLTSVSRKSDLSRFS